MMNEFNPLLDWPAGVMTLGLLAIGVVISFMIYHVKLARQARIVSNFLQEMTDPNIVGYNGFWQFLQDFGFWDGKQFQLEGKMGHGIASPKVVAKVLARVLMEDPSLRQEVASALCVFYHKRRARFISLQSSLPEMAGFILANINQDDERGLRIWHDFSLLIKRRILEQKELHRPSTSEEVDEEYAKGFRTAQRVFIAPEPQPITFLPAKADASAEKSSPPAI